jgi:hypothetical protein
MLTCPVTGHIMVNHSVGTDARGYPDLGQLITILTSRCVDVPEPP